MEGDWAASNDDRRRLTVESLECFTGFISLMYCSGTTMSPGRLAHHDLVQMPTVSLLLLLIFFFVRYDYVMSAFNTMD